MAILEILIKTLQNLGRFVVCSDANWSLVRDCILDVMLYVIAHSLSDLRALDELHSKEAFLTRICSKVVVPIEVGLHTHMSDLPGESETLPERTGALFMLYLSDLNSVHHQDLPRTSSK